MSHLQSRTIAGNLLQSPTTASASCRICEQVRVLQGHGSVPGSAWQGFCRRCAGRMPTSECASASRETFATWTSATMKPLQQQHSQGKQWMTSMPLVRSRHRLLRLESLALPASLYRWCCAALSSLARCTFTSHMPLRAVNGTNQPGCCTLTGDTVLERGGILARILRYCLRLEVLSVHHTGSLLYTNCSIFSESP